MAVRDLYPGYFALVMATGICSTALRDVGQSAASAVLLVVAIGCFAVLCCALGWRLIRYGRRVVEDLSAPDRAFAFFTVVAASNVLGARLAADNHRVAAFALAGFGLAIWLCLTYVIPVRLVLGPRPQPVLAGVNGTWFIWVVGTQSGAMMAAVLDQPADGRARVTALAAVLMWSVGVVLYLVVATLVLTRLLLLEVRPQDLTPPYWVTMGATAITVLAAAQILAMPPAPAVNATRWVVAGLGVMLWAFGTWLIPLLVAFGIWRHVLNRVRLGYLPQLWSIVFPLGMYAVASMELGAVADLPIIEQIGRGWTWVAVTAWSVVFLGMCHSLIRSMLRATRPARPAASTREREVTPSTGIPAEPATLVSAGNPGR
ncbi:MAG TPA: tellurite resistance/C4-dicarboxylate transporter family protein [Micromonosporaceae bacterium]